MTGKTRTRRITDQHVDGLLLFVRYAWNDSNQISVKYLAISSIMNLTQVRCTLCSLLLLCSLSGCAKNSPVRVMRVS